MCFGLRKKQLRQVNKHDIGDPFDFRIVQHIGYNNTNLNYDINMSSKSETERVRAILFSMNVHGVRINKKSIDFAKKFMNENGGLERFEEELKKQIGPPTNFRRLQSIRLDKNKNYDINIDCESEEKKVREIIKALDIQGDIPIDKKTERFALKFIRNNGGIECFEAEVKRQQEQIVPKYVLQKNERAKASLDNKTRHRSKHSQTVK